MSHRIKIMPIFGTRPEAIKMFPVIHAMQAVPQIQTTICVTAQHRAMLDQVLDIAKIKPDIDLDLMQTNQTLDTLMSRLILELGKVLDDERPDRILVHGDTLTTMAATISAYFRKIPVGHVEAGLRSGDIYSPWPEEVNRKVTGAIADLNFAPTQTAADALRKENVPDTRIYVTGNTVIDALLATSKVISGDNTLASGLDNLCQRFGGKKIIAVTSHRRENFGDGMESIALAIADIARRDDIAVIFPIHPNPNVRPAMERHLGGFDNVAMIEPLDYPHFVRLLQMAYVVLTDSGGVQEEAPSFGKPVLVMRDTTERPEGVVAGTAILVGTDRHRICFELSRLLNDPEAYEVMARAHNPFGDGTAGEKIVRIIANHHGLLDD
jgi:UDP-N-acetylglucosamine 2-epimerase (non-hydrolysing)